MSVITPPLFASFLMSRTVGSNTIFSFMLLMLATGVGVLVVICRVIVAERIERTRCRNWPTVSAVVDIASVAYCEPEGSSILHFKASSYNPYYKVTLPSLYFWV